MYKHRIILDQEVLNSSILMDIVYKPLEVLPKDIEGLHLSDTLSIKDTDLAIYTDIKNNTIYVVFRGTSNKEDVITDIAYFPKKFLDTKAHDGFVDALEVVLQKIISMVNTEVVFSLTTRLVICGHSLGGALAQLLFYYANQNDKEFRISKSNIFCITEGSPKVFVERFLTQNHDCFKERAIRITSPDDIVPSLPPRTLLLRITRNSYTHIGQHWDIGIEDYEGEIREHYADKYLIAIRKEVEVSDRNK